MNNLIITSFDIGIRNLAYCIMEYHPENIAGNQFKIHDWNVIDLLEESDNQSKTCQVNYKSGQHLGKLCGQKAHYCVIDSVGKPTSICKTHSKSYSPEKLKRIYTVANITLHELARLAVKKLDKIDFSLSQEVIFETQPSINPKMKNFSMMLFNYFVIRYIAEKEEYEQILKDVKFVSSRNKLTVYDGPYIECKLKNQYSRNKFYGKEYCKYTIRYNNEKLKFFNGFKKKDDLADSFLQGAWYLMNNHKSPDLKKKDKISKNLKIKLNLNPINKIINLTGTDDLQNFNEDNDEIFDEKSDFNELLDQKLDFDILATNPETEKKEKVLDQLIPKIKISLKPKLVGKQQLENIKNNETSKRVRIDHNIIKYKNLKRGIKPLDNSKHYTLSNIRYIIKKKKLSLSNQNPILISSIQYYFGDIDQFNLIVV